MGARQRARMLFMVVALTAALWAVNFIWLHRDTRPPVWDMALHQTYALNYLPQHLAENIPWNRLSGNYPPFVHWIVALCFAVFHPGPHIAVLANIPATLLLFAAIYLLALDLAGATAARWACGLTALVPYMIWMSRETILDYWLAAWLAAGLAALYRSDGFRSRGWSLLLGCICALGLLTKWFFAGFIFFPLLYTGVRHRVWRDQGRMIHLADALLIGGLGAGAWYLPNLSQLIRYYFDNARIGALEGEPGVFSFQSFIYYLRLLEGYQLFGILFAFVALAVFFAWKRRLLRDGGFLAAAVCGGWVMVTLLRTKDPRFSMPLLGLMFIAGGAWVQSWNFKWTPAVKAALIAVLSFQAFAINFGVRWIPQEIVLARGYSGSVSWNWNLYLQHYFHILGAPRREDWQIEPILNRVAGEAGKSGGEPELALVPDLPHFNAATFTLFARLRHLPVRVTHLNQDPKDPAVLQTVRYVVMTEQGQGMSWTTGASREWNRVIVDDPGRFRLLSSYALPDGNRARLYQAAFTDGRLP